MRTQNLVSVYQGALALEESSYETKKGFNTLKSHEIRNLQSFCDAMRNCSCCISDFDGFYVGYSIKQIGKEFDLLSFRKGSMINIEIKGELSEDRKMEKIQKQMRVNYYYLKFLNRELRIFTYVENDGFYEYMIKNDTVIKIRAETVAGCISGSNSDPVDYEADPDKEFIPSNYLISPFNSTEEFMKDEYFLTTDQQNIKKQIQDKLLETSFTYFFISANAGTGKTLLTYDIAKDVIRSGKKVMIIHCGMLNDGHSSLICNYGWNIRSIRDFKGKEKTEIEGILKECSILLIDEAQRIREWQLNLIIQISKELKIPIVFSYDVNQYLKETEKLDVKKYISEAYTDIALFQRTLTTKIRTNKEIASFITNLKQIGRSKDHLNYECITIEYMDFRSAQEYVHFLRTIGWTPLTYTVSKYTPDHFNYLSNLGENAHSVIGQEFSKVVFVMDDNFKYSSSNKLMVRRVGSYYSVEGMLYQIVTRAINELKIIVIGNPELYAKLVEIKSMGESMSMQG